MNLLSIVDQLELLDFWTCPLAPRDRYHPLDEVCSSDRGLNSAQQNQFIGDRTVDYPGLFCGVLLRSNLGICRIPWNDLFPILQGHRCRPLDSIEITKQNRPERKGNELKTQSLMRHR